MTENVWKFLVELHLGNVVNMPYKSTNKLLYVASKLLRYQYWIISDFDIVENSQKPAMKNVAVMSRCEIDRSEVRNVMEFSPLEYRFIVFCCTAIKRPYLKIIGGCGWRNSICQLRYGSSRLISRIICCNNQTKD